MIEAIMLAIRLAMLLFGISITLAVIITLTRYYVGMFTALPIFIPVFIFLIVIVITSFVGGLIE